LWAGVSVLGTPPASFRGIDNFNLSPGGINITDQFSKTEKFQSMQGVQGSGIGSSITTDISSVVGVELSSLVPGGKQVVALAYLADTSLAMLQGAAATADSLYRSVNTAPMPNLGQVTVCPFDSVFALTASNTQVLKVYNDSLLTQLLFAGNSYIQPRTQAPRSYWVTNHDSLFESLATRVDVVLQPSVASATAPDSLILLFLDTTVTVTNTTPGAFQTSWTTPTGGVFIGNQVTIGQSFFTPFFPIPPQFGTFQRILMQTTTAQGCEDTASVVVYVVYLNSLETYKEANYGWKVYPNPASRYIQVHSIQGDALVKATLYTIDGREWEVQIEGEGAQQWLLTVPSGLSPGLYVLRLQGNENAYIGRISLY
jgi:hypothetical protein